MFRTIMRQAACLLLLCAALPAAHGQAQGLDARAAAIARVAAFTASGDIDSLRPALVKGLEAGLTVSEIREVLVQLYAYCGFPRSLNGIHAFMAVLKEREAAGIRDAEGRAPSPMPEGLDRDRYGAETRMKLAGLDTIAPPSGYQVFAPAIDAYLKQHLFADIFYRDNLDWKSRELATVAALAAMRGTAGQQKFHQGAALNMGWTGGELYAVLDIVEAGLGKELADTGRGVLAEVLAARKK